MNIPAAVGRYLWRFFSGDVFQVAALAVAFFIVWLLSGPLGAWDGVVAFALVGAIVAVSVRRQLRR